MARTPARHYKEKTLTTAAPILEKPSASHPLTSAVPSGSAGGARQGALWASARRILLRKQLLCTPAFIGLTYARLCNSEEAEWATDCCSQSARSKSGKLRVAVLGAQVPKKGRGRHALEKVAYFICLPIFHFFNKIK